ncbi:anthrone oxygenase family protein [Kribbella sp. NPDC051620]|uniref:anthrone oxygenase family protein n=1 Tax=Kribbella sp. NPDC051620 TaxID=3364120 RepID=UPI0037A235ED
MRFIRLANIWFAGLFAGFLLTVLVLEQSLRRFDAHVYTQVRQVELVQLDALASVTLLPAIITTAVLVLRSRRATTIAALVLLAGVFALTLAVNLPINHDQTGWAIASPPADWADIRDRWQFAHLLRTVAAIGAFALLIGVPEKSAE